MVSTIIPVDPFDLVIFGATGDLAQRKILPSLYRLVLSGQVPAHCRIIGAARRSMSRKQFQDAVFESLAHHSEEASLDSETLEKFLHCGHVVLVDVTGDSGWNNLGSLLAQDANEIRAFYLSVGPSLFGVIAERLSAAGVVTPLSRVVLEKPLENDLATAIELNRKLS